MGAIEIKPKSDKTRWVALDILNGYTIVAEGRTPEQVMNIAENKNKRYVLSWVPKAGKSYIF